MAHRRRVQDGVARRHRIDLGRIGVARDGQHAMGQHRALGAPGRARSVEQPGEVVRRTRDGVGADRVDREQALILGATDGSQRPERLRREGRDDGVEARRGETARAPECSRM